MIGKSRFGNRGLSIAARYAFFALIATMLNLGCQRLVLALGNGGLWEFSGAVLLGTAVGLIVKYLLDKKWIFLDQTAGLAAHGQKFGLYTMTGVATTTVFWGLETGFWMIWRTEAMRELGAIAGLAIGYAGKYALDRRFVFA